MLNNYTLEIAQASFETLYMVLFSTIGSVLLGWPLGTLLFMSERLHHRPILAKILGLMINTTRSIPFIIFMVAILPLTRFILGSAIGVNAAILALTLGATPLFARLTTQAYEQLPSGILECGHAIGASPWQMIQKMFILETLPMLFDAITMTAITLIGYSAMAGAIGGGGLGDLAIRYGYQRFDTHTMMLTVLILIIMVQCIQWTGLKLRQKIQH
ncbi:MAG: ABC transporter permease [Gammaproteobacteria bacterium]|nr:ABC transporter permease [Gammaproteobacteria bacterium]